MNSAVAALVGVLAVLATASSSASEALASASASASTPAPQPLLTIAFGSCNRADEDQPLWPRILEREPDVWIWGGDNVYADYRPKTLEQWREVWRTDREAVLAAFPRPPFFGSTPENLRATYARQKEVPGYKALVERLGPSRILPIYDDHDYGENDFGKHYVHKVESQVAFLDFFEVPSDDPRRHREGIYHFVDIDEVRVVLLDNRYHRDDYDDPEGDMLGAEQWQWLEEEALGPSSAKVTVVVSGIQVLPESTMRFVGENWSRLGANRQRLLDMLAASAASNVVLISGDVHFAEISQANFSCADADADADADAGAGASPRFVLPEVTSSGMTHSWATMPKPLHWAIYVAQRILPFRYSISVPYLGLNFGELLVFDDRIEVSVVDVRGAAVMLRTWRFDELKPASRLAKCSHLPYHGRVATKAEELPLVALWVVVTLAPLLALIALCCLGARRACCPRKPSSKRKTL